MLNNDRRLKSVDEYKKIYKILNKICKDKLYITGSINRNDIYISDLDCLLECENDKA